MKLLDKTFSLFCATIILTSFAILSNQNLILSNDFNLLILREVDDYAFQIILREIHSDLENFKFVKLITTSNYGYGAIFWFINSLITFPFYLAGFDNAVILLPRYISQLFGFLAVIFIYKTSTQFTSNKIISYSVATILVLQPIFAYACLRFHSHSQVLFFSTASFYFLVLSSQQENIFDKFYKKKLLLKAILFAGIAIGTKINALIILPVFATVFLFSNNWKPDKLVINQIILFFLISLLTAILFFNPAIIFFPLFFSESIQAINTLAYYILKSGNVDPHPYNHQLYPKIVDGIFKYYSGYLSIFLPLIVLCTGYMRFRSNRSLGLILISIAGTFFFSAIILAFRIKAPGAPTLYATYLIPLTIVFCLSPLMFDKLNLKLTTTSLFLIISLMLLENGKSLYEMNFKYQVKSQSENTLQKIKDHKTLIRILKPNKTKYLIDFRLAVPLSPFETRIQKNYFYNNFGEVSDNFDYILISKIANQTLSELNASEEKARDPNMYVKEVKLLKKLLVEGTYFKNKYMKIYENKTMLVFEITK